MKRIVHALLGIESEPAIEINSVRKASKWSPQYVRRLKTSAERVNFVLQNITVGLSDGGRSTKKLRKNSTVARQLRERGNAFYKAKEFSTALECYNVATMFAPAGDTELGLAFANRSIVLLELGHPEEAMADIELALLNNYPKASVLERRRRKCNEMIDQRNEIRDDDDEEQLLRIQIEEEKKEREKMREEVLRIKNPNPKIPEAADFVKIEYDQGMGRKLVVTQDVPAGTVLMVSYPYVTTLARNDGWHSERCHHCLKRVLRGIPCDRCVFAFYCTESCKNEALEEYHRFECPCMNHLHFDDMAAAMALRSVCKAGPKKLFQLFQTQEPAYFNPREPYGTAEDCVFNEDPYLAVYHMIAHSEKIDEAMMSNARRTFSAVILASNLESRSPAFFEEIPKIRRAEFKKFVATMLRHHIDSFKINLASVDEVTGLEGISTAEFYGNAEASQRRMYSSTTEPFASAMYPLGSLLSHSCVNNVYFVTDAITGKGRKATIAAHALKAGDVLYANYSAVFTDHPLEYRQQRARDRYFFTCRCAACVYEWPTKMEALVGGFFEATNFCCPTCSAKYSTIERASPEFKKKCELNAAGSWKCGSCAKQYSEDALQLLHATKMQVGQEGSELCRGNRPREAIPKLLQTIDFLQTHLCPPPYLQTAVENYCAHALALLFHSLPCE